MQLIDTHCHVHFDKYPLEQEETLERARQAGVNKLICVGTSLADSQAAIDFAGAHENVWASVGEHPHDGQEFLKNKKASEFFEDLLSRPKVCAVGEIGLDYYHEHTSRADQEKALRLQLEVSAGSGLPYIFHVRDAWSDFFRIFDDYDIKRGVIHSFAAGTKALDKVLERGLYVGLNGIMTFTRDEAQLAAARKIPLDKLVLETDAPFLTPKADAGQPCEPRHVKMVAEFLAEQRGEDIEELAAATTANAERLFGI